MSDAADNIISKYPPAKPGALRLGAPQRGPIPNL